MNSEQFEKIFDEVVDNCRSTLLVKASEYATDKDRLHNFHKAAALMGGTPEQALWGFLVKHLVSISDMVESSYAFPEAVWEEKIGDALNYLILLRAMVKEAA